MPHSVTGLTTLHLSFKMLTDLYALLGGAGGGAASVRAILSCSVS